MHRYETAFREKNMEGYLPVTIAMEKDPYGKSAVAQTPEPTFTYKVLAADAGPVVPDPVTGMVKPGRTIAKTYRLESNLVRRVAAPGARMSRRRIRWRRRRRKGEEEAVEASL